MRKLILTCLFLACAHLLLAQTISPTNNILYVDINSTGSDQSGDSWANAVPQLFTALQWASTNQSNFTTDNPLQIWVADGTYLPTNNLSDRNATFQLVDNIEIYGGFAGDEISLEARDWQINISVLSGDLNQDDGSDFANNWENVYHVVTGGFYMDGFTVTGGNANGNLPNDRGAGLKILGSGANIFKNMKVVGNIADFGGGVYIDPNFYVSMNNVHINENTAVQSGGGIYSMGNSPGIDLTNMTIGNNTVTAGNGGGIFFNEGGIIQLTNVNINGNMANLGGGIYNNHTAPRLNDSSIEGNSASEGGGMYNYYSSPILTNIVVSENNAVSGGGIYSTNSNPILINITIKENTAGGGDGGGIYNDWSSPHITNGYFISNSASKSGGGMYSFHSGYVMTNVLIAGNEAGGGWTSNPDYDFWDPFEDDDEYMYLNIGGGGLFNYESSPTLTNVTIYGNQAAYRGGGVFNMNTDFHIRNSIFRNNSISGGSASAGPTEGYSIYSNHTHIYLDNSFLSNAPFSVSGWVWSIDNTNGFTGDPQLNANGRLQNGSPAINTGNNAFLPADTEDIDDDGDTAETMPYDIIGNVRILEGTVDVGAFEYPSILPDTNNVVYVDINANGGNKNGNSWTNAVSQLFTALRWASANQSNFTTEYPLQIWVANGTYLPTDNLSDRNATFQLVDNVKIYGGFAGGEISLDARNWQTNVCIFSGDLNQNDGPDFANNGENVYHVVNASGTNYTAILDGFIIIGGNAEGSDLYALGGGIFNQGGSPRLYHLIITGNKAVHGGGIFNEWTGLLGASANFHLKNVVISKNVSINNGGGIYNSNSLPVLTNVTISGNTAINGTGGGFYNTSAEIFEFISSPAIRNSIIWGNSNNSYVENDGSIPFFFNSIVEGIAGDDPLFTNPENNDYTLQTNSPAINGGSNVFIAAEGELGGQIDLAGNPRVYEYTNQSENFGIVDIGAYEYQGAELTFIYQDDGVGWLSPMGNPNGLATMHDDVLVRNGTANFTQDLQIGKLTVNANANLQIEQALTMSKDIANNGNILFKSNDAMLGQLGPMEMTIRGEGEMTVERHIPARDNDVNGAYRYLASSVNSTGTIHANWQEDSGSMSNPNPGFGMFITGEGGAANGFDTTPANAPSMFTFDNTNQAYVPVANTNVNLIAGQAYTAYVWGDRSVDILTSNDPVATSTTLRAAGDLAIGDQPISDLNPVAGGFSLIGNPYQAILDMNQVLASSTNLNTFFYYVWDPNLGTRGAYATVDLSNPGATPGSEANQYLMPGQAVWVTTSTNAASTLTFEESDKAVTVDPTDVFKAESDLTFIELQLFQADRYANGQRLSDVIRVYFSETGDNTVLQNDAPKLFNMDENLARANGTNLFSIENRAMPFDEEILPLYNDQYRTQHYIFKAMVTNLPSETTVYLLDNYLGTQSELANNETTPIEFTVDTSIYASIAADRFSLVFSKNFMDVDSNLLTDELSIYPNPVKNKLHINMLNGLSIESVSVFDMLGKGYDMKIGADNTLDVSQMPSGIYVLKLETSEGSLTKKFIKE